MQHWHLVGCPAVLLQMYKAGIQKQSALECCRVDIARRSSERAQIDARETSTSASKPLEASGGQPASLLEQNTPEKLRSAADGSFVHEPGELLCGLPLCSEE